MIIYYFQRLLERSDHDQDGHLNFADFLKYVTEHEKHLRLSFHMLDHNKDGKFNLHVCTYRYVHTIHTVLKHHPRPTPPLPPQQVRDDCHLQESPLEQSVSNLNCCPKSQ